MFKVSKLLIILGLTTITLVVGCKSDQNGLVKIFSGQNVEKSCEEVKAKPTTGKLALVYYTINYSTDWYLARVTGVYSGGTKVAADILEYYGGPVDRNVIVNSDKVRAEQTGCEGITAGKKVLATYYQNYNTITASATVLAIFEGEQVLVEIDGDQTGSSKFKVLEKNRIALSDN